MRQPQVAIDLYAGDGMLMAWHRKPIAPWQTPEWLERSRVTPDRRIDADPNWQLLG
jgi:hypothetical protein